MFGRTFLALCLFLLPLGAQVVVNEVVAANDSVVVPGAPAGEFPDYIEIANLGGSAVDLGGWRLSDQASDSDKWRFPAGSVVAPGGFLLVLAGEDGESDASGNLRTNFGLSSDGETVLLFNPSGAEVSRLATEVAFQDDEAFGRDLGTGMGVFLPTASPGAANASGGGARNAAVLVSPGRGFYSSAQSVTLTAASGSIFYTLDGSEPLTSSGAASNTAVAYTGPIAVTETLVLRAATAGPRPLAPVSHSYFLVDIDNAGADGSDAAGLNAKLLRQVQPAGWGDLSSGDFEMDRRISENTEPSVGHPGESVAQALLKSLRELPTVSISLPRDDFSGTSGIYANSQERGAAWERACSVEYLPAEGEGGDGFAEYCGLRVQGGASRNPDRSPKHSLSLRFRRQYGVGRLRYDLFPGSKVKEFNSLGLRAFYNNSWIHFSSAQRRQASMIRDQWMRDSMIEMGHEDGGRGKFAHIYINGLYWGVHNLVERQDNTHYANHNGGNEDQIDSRNGGTFNNGTMASFQAMQATVASRNWTAVQQVLDVDNYIDYQILQEYASNGDLKVDGNWRAAGGGAAGVPWRIYSWDGERTLEGVTSAFQPLDPFAIRDNMERIPQYRARYEERLLMHTASSGALSPTKTQARWERSATVLERAVHAETARWADHRTPTDPYEQSDWLAERERLVERYFPVRTDRFLSNLRTRGGLAPTNAPTFTIAGTEVAPGETGYLNGGTLQVVPEAGGTLYFTTDGSDPRGADGMPTAGAEEVTVATTLLEVLPYNSTGWRYRDNNLAQPATWTEPTFDDSGWPLGDMFFGRGVGSQTTATNLNLGTNANPTSSFYFRRDFALTDVSDISSLDFEMIVDDGVILYLNGVELTRNNVADDAHESYAPLSGSERTPVRYTLDRASRVLQEGRNVLAVMLKNRRHVADAGLNLRMLATRVAQSGLPLDGSSQIAGRYRVDGVWSALVRVNVVANAVTDLSDLRISEVNYHPWAQSGRERRAAGMVVENSDLYEFVELWNSGTRTLNSSGLRFSEGIRAELPFATLAPGERGVVVRDEAAFAQRYGSGVRVLGTFEGSLDNDGEVLALARGDGTVLERFEYNDGGSWPRRADGLGSSLERVAGVNLEAGSEAWRASVSFFGSPGEADRAASGVVINEVGSNVGTDFVEFYQPESAVTNVGGWWLTDDREVPDSAVLPSLSLMGMGYNSVDESVFRSSAGAVTISGYAGTSGTSPVVVTASGHGLSDGDTATIDGYGGFSRYEGTWRVTVLDANRFSIPTRFLDNNGQRGAVQSGRSFGLSSTRGEDLTLIEVDLAGRPVAFADEVAFGAASGVSLGRWPNGAGLSDLVPLSGVTRNAANDAPVQNGVILTEVFVSGLEGLQFVELSNRTQQAFSLERYRLRGGIDFDFADSDMLAAGESAVVVFFDPTRTDLRAAFQMAHNIPPGVRFFGPATDGPLQMSAATVRLEEKTSNARGEFFRDEVRFLTTSPWPSVGAGQSIHRTGGFGRLAESWFGAEVSPGRLSVPAGGGFAAWASQNGVGSELEDPDGDGVENLLEFALGLDPREVSEPVMVGDAVRFLTSPGSGVPVVLERSADLVNWAVVPTVAEGGLVNGRQMRRGDLAVPRGEVVFYRVRVE